MPGPNFRRQQPFICFALTFCNSSMSVLKQIAEYLYLSKKDPNQPRTQWLKYMHGINRISILLFLLAMVILVVKLLIKM